MKFKTLIFQARKVMEFSCRSWKSWKFKFLFGRLVSVTAGVRVRAN